jgi:hypothetical protein
VLLVFTLVASIGGLLALVVMSMYAVTHALAALSASLGVSVQLIMLLVSLLSMILLALPAWWVIGGIRRAYRAKWLSDQMLVFDAIWLFQALILCKDLIFAVGLAGWVGLAAFVAYKLISTIGLRPLAVAASRRPAAKLLLLRVFGFRRRIERLFDVLAARWRYAGPIQMIAAPDLAGRTIDPGEFMDFLSGRLRRQFVIEPGDLQRRLAEIDLRPDADGRFRVNDIFCGNDTWQAAVERLMAQSDLVAMDLRGFSPQNRGCTFELQALLDTVPITRFVLLVDNSTDRPLLRRTLTESAGRMAPASPNSGSIDPLTLLEVGRDDRRAVDVLLAVGDAVLAGAPGPARKAAGFTPA